MNGVSQELVRKIAEALNVRDTAPVKSGVAYRIVVFKVKEQGLWVSAMLPDFIAVEELFDVVNKSYGLFLAGLKTPNGIVFIRAEKPEDLVMLSKNWYEDLN